MTTRDPRPPYTPSIPPRPYKLTYEDYAEIPNDGKRYEVIDGELYVTPAPIPKHQRVSINLEFVLVRDLQRKGLGTVLDAPIDVVLSDHDIVQPDIIFIRKEREERLVGPKFIEGPPDLVIEILSPSTRRTDVKLKSKLYERFGVENYWIADPDLDRIEFFRLEGDRYVLEALVEAPEIARPAAFPGLEIPLAEVFA